jgi:hypothetical protein
MLQWYAVPCIVNKMQRSNFLFSVSSHNEGDMIMNTENSFHIKVTVKKISSECMKVITGDKKKFFTSVSPYIGSQDSVVSIATGYRLNDRGVRVRVPVGSRTFSSPCHPDQFWGPPNLLSNGYQGLFPRGG